MIAAAQQITSSFWAELERVLAQLQRHAEARVAHGNVFDLSEPLRDCQRRSADSSEERYTGDASENQLNPVERLRNIFGLSTFETDLLLLCAGVALDHRFTEACRSIQSSSSADLSLPSFGLAASALDDPHWSAMSRIHPLRYWRLIELGPGSLLHAPLGIDERILHYLLGVPTIDERLDFFMRVLEEDGTEERDHGIAWHKAVRRGALHWQQMNSISGHLLLTGAREAERTELFRALCRETGLRAWTLDSADLPGDAAECEKLARACTREAALGSAALLVQTHRLERTDALETWLHRVHAPVAVEVEDGTPAEQLRGFRVETPRFTSAESKGIWMEQLGNLAAEVESELDAIVETFAMDPAEVRQSAEDVRDEVALNGSGPAPRVVWNRCRTTARRSLDDLAVRIDSSTSWNDLVLPDGQVDILRQIVANARHSTTVLRKWGFAKHMVRGLGLSALFAGPSGTGKTMAAAILARDLERDLYQIDLSAMVSKYIGETEKHLRRVFDAAERSGAVLLFDEADALFGKRSQVRDSHDRYANLEISYLLQRMESYRGIAILTTNMPSALDTAFQRRLRFVVQFPFPDAMSREHIWRRVFPTEAPVSGLDFGQLAQLNITGGTIRNIALLAAFLAAAEKASISMQHILSAARTEYAKLEKPLSAAETRGWQ